MEGVYMNSADSRGKAGNATISAENEGLHNLVDGQIGISILRLSPRE
jgi:hypothetical protein